MKNFPFILQQKKKKREKIFQKSGENSCRKSSQHPEWNPHLFYANALQETYGKNPGKARVSSIGSIWQKARFCPLLFLF